MKRFFFVVLGFFFVALAVLGVVLPGLPTTPFLLVAAACFAKSSPKLYFWLVNNKIFGPLIRNWQETRSIPRKAKKIALATIAVVAVSSVIFISNIYLKIFVAILIIFPVAFLYRLRETEDIFKA